jgi:hypothetical protein
VAEFLGNCLNSLANLPDFKDLPFVNQDSRTDQ